MSERTHDLRTCDEVEETRCLLNRKPSLKPRLCACGNKTTCHPEPNARVKRIRRSLGIIEK